MARLAALYPLARIPGWSPWFCVSSADWYLSFSYADQALGTYLHSYLQSNPGRPLIPPLTRMPTLAHVAVIVLNWNGGADTLQCVRSLLEQEYESFGIIVVDNASSDGSVNLLENRLEGESVEYVLNDDNYGFSGGNNRGMLHALAAETKYVMLVNNDTVVKDRLLIKKMVDAFQQDQRIGLACPTIYYAQPAGKPWYAGASYSLWLGGGKHIQTLPSSMGVTDTGYATGCCVMASRSAIEDVGLLDDVFFLYHEDVDWSLRMKARSWRVVYVPQAEIVHKVSQSSRDLTGRGAYSPEAVYYKARNRILLIRKHGNVIQKDLIWPLIIVADSLYRSLAYLSLGRWEKLRAMFRGTSAGLRLDVRSSKDGQMFPR